MDKSNDFDINKLSAVFGKAEESCMALKDVLLSVKTHTVQTATKITDLEISSREMKERYDKLESRLEKECADRIRERAIFVDIIRQLKTRMNKVLAEHEDLRKNSSETGKINNVKLIEAATQSYVSLVGNNWVRKKKRKNSTLDCESSICRSNKLPKMSGGETENSTDLDNVVVKDEPLSPEAASSSVEKITDIPGVHIKDEPMSPTASIKVPYSPDIDIKEEPISHDVIDDIVTKQEQLTPVKVNKSMEPMTATSYPGLKNKELSVTGESFGSVENNVRDIDDSCNEENKNCEQSSSPLQGNSCNNKCNVSLTTDKQLKRQSLSPGYKYMCHECGGLSDSKSAHNVHLMSHANLIKYECRLCMKIYCGMQDYKAHMLTHAEKQYNCDQCSKFYSYKSDLVLHKMVAHDVCE